MNLHSLRYFYEATKYSSLTEASHYLHISQPALTKHIKNLEEEYGVRLVEKNGRLLSLTDLGEELIKECDLLFQQSEKIEQLLKQKSSHIPLKVGVTQLNSEEFIKHILVNDKFKDIQIELTTDNTQKISQLLINHFIDVALLPDTPTLVDFKREKIFSDKLIFVAHPDYCKSNIYLKELNSYSFIKREDGSFIQDTLDNWQTNLYFSNQVATHNEALLLAQYKNGIYLCSSMQAKSLIASEKLKEITIEGFPVASRDFYLYFNKNKQVKYFKQYVKEIIAEIKRE